MSMSRRAFKKRDDFFSAMEKAGNLTVTQLIELLDIDYQTLVDVGLLNHLPDSPLFLSQQKLKEQVTFIGQIFFIASGYPYGTFFKQNLLPKLKQYLAGSESIALSINEFDSRFSFNGYVRIENRTNIALMLESDIHKVYFKETFNESGQINGLDEEDQVSAATVITKTPVNIDLCSIEQDYLNEEFFPSISNYIAEFNDIINELHSSELI